MNTWKEEIYQQADHYLEIGAVGEMIKTIVDLAERNEQVTNVVLIKRDFCSETFELRVVYGDTMIFVNYRLDSGGTIYEYGDDSVLTHRFDKPYEAYGIMKEILV